MYCLSKQLLLQCFTFVSLRSIDDSYRNLKLSIAAGNLEFLRLVMNLFVVLFDVQTCSMNLYLF